MQWLIIKTTSLETIKADKADYALLEQNDDSVQFTPSNGQAIKDQIGNRRVILLIPSEEVGLHHVDIPAASNKQLTKAIPFALEESLAEDIDALHFTFQRDNTDKINGTVNVATMSNQRLQQWHDIISQEWGIKLHAILPDLFALPADDQTSSLAVDQTRALYRYNTFWGTSCSSDLLPLLFPSFLISDDDPETEQPPTLLLDTRTDLTLDVPEYIDVQTASLRNNCHSSLLTALPLNLLIGFGQNEQQALLKQLSKWKIPAILAGLAATLWVITTGLQNYRSQQHLDQLNSAINTIYTDTLPNATVDSDYRINHQIMAEKLDALGVVATKTDSPLEPLALVTPILKKNKAISLKKLSIDKQALILTISTTSVNHLEKFHANINRNATFQAEIKSQSTSGNKVIAKLHIHKKKP
jgi:general secretion pathway protein L